MRPSFPLPPPLSPLLPPSGIDLLNHGGSAANGQLVLGKASWQLQGEPAVCFVTTNDIATGQQVRVLGAQGRRKGGGGLSVYTHVGVGVGGWGEKGRV